MSATSAQALKHPLVPPAEGEDSPATAAVIRCLRAELAAAERRLRESDERWMLLLLATEDGIWDWVPGTERMSWSPQLTRMLGYADGEIAPSVAAFNALLHQDDSASVWRAFDEHVAGKTELFECEFRLRAKDRSYRWIRSRGKAKVDERGTAVRMVGLLADVTARKQVAADAADSPVATRAPIPGPRLTDGSLDLPVAHARCRICHGERLFRSRWRLWERPMILLLRRPVRCRSCGRRSFKPLWAGVPGRADS